MDAQEVGMMAPCGLDCETCDVRLVTSDPKAARRVVAWFRRMEWLDEDEGVEEIVDRGMYCLGCRGDRTLHWSPDCPILVCCVDERQLAHCAECDARPCDELEAFAEQSEAHAEAVDRLRQIASS